MTDVEKGMIIALCWVYGVYATVSKIVGRPRSTVKSFLERHYIRGTTSNRKRSGRPEKLTKRQKRQILRAVKNDRRCTREEIRKLFCPNVTHSTLDRLLQKHNIRKWLAKKRPLLTEEHARKWLKWAMERRAWTVEDFEGIIWSDECSVAKNPIGSQIWVFRTP